MTQTPTIQHRGGWRQEETDILFSAVKEAAEAGRPLRDVFAAVGEQLQRKPNSIRNYYYARVREEPCLAARQTPFRAFTPQELDMLLRHVLIGRGEGRSVRACVAQLAQGDRAGMLRYQNKYRSILKNKPDMLNAVAQELRAEGLPCPDNATCCRRYERAAKGTRGLERLEAHMDAPGMRKLLDGLTELLERPAAPAEPDMAPYAKWAEVRREADRLRVENDLLKMALEDARQPQPEA